MKYFHDSFVNPVKIKLIEKYSKMDELIDFTAQCRVLTSIFFEIGLSNVNYSKDLEQISNKIEEEIKELDSESKELLELIKIGRAHV